MMRVEAAGATDTGQTRPANEDAYIVGESVFAVADGMGGHLAGEVASATALEPIDALDGHVYQDAADAVRALTEAVVAANERVSQMAADEPSYRGMGTTLTATMLEGRRIHVAHVGDSRAYLRRGDGFSRLTDDHTLVQHLVDEGQITEEEAANHPQRSIVTRAIGVSREVEVDSMTLDLEPGDQLLLCSDGLTGVVDEERIAEELDREGPPSQIVDRLIELANEAGGPDNITAILLRVSGDEPSATSAADSQPLVVSTSTEDQSADWAHQLGSYGSLSRDGPWGSDPDHDRKRGRSWLKLSSILFAVLLLVALIAGGGRFLLAQSYYVGLDGDEVVIYQGVDFELGPLELHRVVQRTGVTTDELQTWFVEQRLEDGIAAAGLNDARLIVRSAPRTAEAAEAADTTPAEDTTPAADDDP